MQASTLGSMEPGANWPWAMLASLGHGLVDVFLVGLVEVDADLLDGGQDDQHVGAEVGSQQRRAVLVDDGGRPSAQPLSVSRPAPPPPVETTM